MSTLRIALLPALLCGLLAVMPHAVTAWLVFDRDAILDGQIWRLWTGHGVHFSWQHAMTDGLVLFVATWVLACHVGARAVAWIFLAGAPLIALGLLLVVPDLRVYAGASGVVMLVAGAACGRLWRDVPRLRSLLGLLAIAAIIRMILDVDGGLSPLSTLPDGIRVVWQAHALGLILGVLSAGRLGMSGAKRAEMAAPAGAIWRSNRRLTICAR